MKLHHDRPLGAHNYRTSITVGAAAVRQSLGFTGRGVGIAVIDSGITTWHDDLTGSNLSSAKFPYGNQRVRMFVVAMRDDPVLGRRDGRDGVGIGPQLRSAKPHGASEAAHEQRRHRPDSP